MAFYHQLGEFRSVSISSLIYQTIDQSTITFNWNNHKIPFCGLFQLFHINSFHVDLSLLTQDYLYVNRTYPTSCCALQGIIEPTSISRRPMASAVVYRTDELNIFNTRDQHNRNLTDIAENARNHVISRSSSSDSSSSLSQQAESSRAAAVAVCRAIHTQVSFILLFSFYFQRRTISSWLTTAVVVHLHNW